MWLVSVLIVSLGVFASAEPLSCSACASLVSKIAEEVAKVEKSHPHTVQTSFRMNNKQRTPYARTEASLMDNIEAAQDESAKWGCVEAEGSKLVAVGSKAKTNHKCSKAERKAVRKLVAALVDDSVQDMLDAFRKGQSGSEATVALCVDLMKVCSDYATAEKHLQASKDVVAEAKRVRDEKEAAKKAKELAEKTEREAKEAEEKAMKEAAEAAAAEAFAAEEAEAAGEAMGDAEGAGEGAAEPEASAGGEEGKEEL